MAIALVTTIGRNTPLQDSVAFAHVAERFRRAGDLHRAVALCRDGLKRFPTHVSARVTLGLALLDLAQYSQARAELQQALKRAPDNLAAIRGLAQLHDHPDDSSHLDDDEDLRAQNHWRSLVPHAESSTRPELSMPFALGAAPVALPQAALAARVHSQPVRSVRADVETKASRPEADTPAPQWASHPDLAAYEAALPLNIAPMQVAASTLEIHDILEELPAPLEFARPQPRPLNPGSEAIAAALERLLSQVNSHRLMAT